ncbi:MAG: hypothetical protein WC651_00115 [Candidatus Gracilibacteria bacterium]|jgi:hypothetical protein
MGNGVEIEVDESSGLKSAPEERGGGSANFPLAEVVLTEGITLVSDKVANVVGEEGSGIPETEEEKRVSAEVMDVSKLGFVFDRNVGRGPLNKGAGKLRDRIDAENDWFEKMALSRERAMAFLSRFFSSEKKEFDLVRGLAIIDKSRPTGDMDLTSSLTWGYGKKRESRSFGMKRIRELGYYFPQCSVFWDELSGFDFSTIEDCPRAFKILVDKLKKMRIPENAVEFQILALLAARVSIEDPMERIAVSSEGEEEDCRSIHRVQSAMSQMAISLSSMVAEKNKTPGVSNSSSLLFKRYFKANPDVDKESEVRGYIVSMLSLLFPDKAKVSGLVSEDYTEMHRLGYEEFLLPDLKFLAEEYGLDGEFAEVFDGIYFYRRVQNLMFHFFPAIEADESKYGVKRKMSLIDAFNFWRDGRTENGLEEKEPVVFSLGHGDGLNEIVAKELCGAKVIVGVDVDKEEELDFDEGRDGEGIKFAVIKTGGMKKGELVDKVFEKAGEGMGKGVNPDIIIVTEALHETENAKEYLFRLINMLADGGTIYLTDLAWSRIFESEDVTRKTQGEMDSAEVKASIRSVEDLFEAFAYFADRDGFRLKRVTICPPFLAQFNDSFWRVAAVGRKPEKDEAVIDYALPEESVDWSAQIETADDIFKVWPLVLIQKADRRKLTEALGQRVPGGIDGAFMPEENGGKRRISFGEVKGMVLKWLIPSGGPVEYGREKRLAEIALWEQIPHKGIEGFFGEDPKFKRANYLAGEVKALSDALLRIGIDIDSKVRESPSWKFFKRRGEE